MAQVQQFLGAGRAVGPGLVRGDGELALEQLFAGGGEGAVLGGEPFQPAGCVQVGHDERVAAPGAQGEVDEDGAAARPGEGGVAEEAAGGVQGGGDDDRGVRGERVHAGQGLHTDAQVPGAGGHAVDEAAPAAARVVGLRRQLGGAAQAFLDEGGGEGAGVVVEEGDGGVVGGGARTLLAGDAGGPGEEVGVDGGMGVGAAQQLQQGERRDAVQGAVVAEPKAGGFQGREGREGREEAEEAALPEPGPVRAAAVEGVGALVGPVGALGGAGAAAEGVVRFVEGDFGSCLGGGDGRGQSGEAAADDGDALHGWVLPRSGSRLAVPEAVPSRLRWFRWFVATTAQGPRM
ncbi:hypothetical protein SHIRM173S_08658 [Streptomyces hirsutus]